MVFTLYGSFYIPFSSIHWPPVSSGHHSRWFRVQEWLIGPYSDDSTEHISHALGRGRPEPQADEVVALWPTRILAEIVASPGSGTCIFYFHESLLPSESENFSTNIFVSYNLFFAKQVSAKELQFSCAFVNGFHHVGLCTGLLGIAWFCCMSRRLEKTKECIMNNMLYSGFELNCMVC